MKSHKKNSYLIFTAFFLSLPAIWILVLQILRINFSLSNTVGIVVFYLGVLIISFFLRRIQEMMKFKLDWIAIILIALFVFAMKMCFEFVESAYSWLLLMIWLILNYYLKTYFLFSKNKFVYLLQLIIWSGCIGTFLISIDQIQTGFSEEEFFTAVQTIELWMFIFFLSLANERIIKQFAQKQKIISSKVRIFVSGITLIIFILFLYFSLSKYQRSFYPQTASLYPGITQIEPFLCSTLNNSKTSYPMRDSQQIFEIVIQKIIANPYKNLPEFGFLSLVTEDQKWQTLFHDYLLEEANQGEYTEPANSVKYDQYYAATRIYYFSRVVEKYPELFTQVETTVLKNWFADINRRAMTVEWVDWMYASAFSKWPEGPYENQEIGSGLLSLLLANNLSAPELIERNVDYLERNRKGWQERFRNTDDAFIYQSIWITNAYFQSLYFGDTGIKENMEKSFEWLLVQTMPGGGAPQYNFPENSSLLGVMLFGASLTQNGQYLWLAERALEKLNESEGDLYAYPGMENIRNVAISVEEPKKGSCLIYGNSGLPNQEGPLAPDKLVFRSGWSDNDSYLLLNLRSMGWHKYKSTGTISAIFQGQNLISEIYKNENFNWLPAGRSKFRDKRIPREILNGFIIERFGLNKVLCDLLFCQSEWAQNPPFYMSIDSFDLKESFDYIKTSLQNWGGWNYQREIFFYHDGPIFIVDRAIGGPKQKAGISWIISGKISQIENQLWAENQFSKSQSIFVPLDSTSMNDFQMSGEDDNPSRLLIGSKNGQIRLLSIVMPPGSKINRVSAVQDSEQINIELSIGSVTTNYELQTP